MATAASNNDDSVPPHEPTVASNSKDESTEQESGQKRQLTPITEEGERPQKKFYRSRAHVNPLSHNNSFDYPLTPKHMDWQKEHYPELPKGTIPNVLDIGCGFGGLTLALATLLPQDVILGMEIRAKVTEYVRLRVVACRKEHSDGSYQNCSVMRTNSMKFLPHFLPCASATKLFFCFPDPHFKRKNHGRRIISERLLSEYAYLLKERARLYCITDVKELHDWHVAKCDAHPMFVRLNDAEMAQDPCVEAMKNETEEGKKVERSGSAKYYAVYERISNDSIPSVDPKTFFVTKDDDGLS